MGGPRRGDAVHQNLGSAERQCAIRWSTGLQRVDLFCLSECGRDVGVYIPPLRSDYFFSRVYCLSSSLERSRIAVGRGLLGDAAFMANVLSAPDCASFSS